MRFMIDRLANQMCIDNAIAGGMNFSALAATIALVVWDGFSGEIESTDGPAVRTVFADPSPYQPYLNSWMTIVAGASPPLTVAQAKSIKLALVNAIYEAKRLAPITVGGQTYEATNEAITAMAAGLTWTDFAALTAAINSSIGTLPTNVNQDMQELANQNNSNFSTLASDCTYLQDVFVSGAGGSYAYIADFIATRGAPTAGLNAFGFLAYRPTVTLTAVPAPPALSVSGSPPVGAPVPAALAQRRNSLLGVRGTKQGQVAAITTMAAAIAYDATSGWP